MGGHLLEATFPRVRTRVSVLAWVPPQGLSMSSSPCSTLNRVKQEQCGKVRKVPGSLCAQESRDCGGMLWSALEESSSHSER